MAYLIQNYQQGEKIIDEFSDNNHMFILMEGEVEIFTKKMNKKLVLGTIRANETEKPFIGEMAMLFNIKRTANVSCKTDCKVLIIKNEEDLINFFKKSPKFALYCFKELSNRLYNTTRKFLQNEDNLDYLKIQLSQKKNIHKYKI